MRIDKLIFTRGLALSRTRACAMIAEGAVYVGGAPVKRPSEDFPEDADIEIRESDASRYVGRGALKLEGAMDHFGIDPTGMTAVDIGASTGGFTQCLLERGAARVYAIDSGHGQLAPMLREDPRVVSIEGFNARRMTSETVGGGVDIAVMDVSFISQRLLYPAVSGVLGGGGVFVSLIKPQFEAGRAAVGRGGLVRDKKDHVRVINELFSEATVCGLAPTALMRSPLLGGDGNTEYLALFTAHGEGSVGADKIKEVVYEA